MKRHALTAEQASDLSQHLGEILSGEHLAAAVAAIDRAAFVIALARKFEASIMTPLRTRARALAVPGAGDRLERLIRVTPGDYRRGLKESHARMLAVAKHAEALLALLRDESHFLETAGLPWLPLEGVLTTLAESARAEAAYYDRPATGRGRAPDEVRDKLIATIHSVYPLGAAKKSKGSHFERTVELVLGFFGRDVENVHGLIVDALRRKAPSVATTEIARR